MVAPQSAAIERVYRELESEARQAFATEGVRPVLTRSADLRYQGQGFELQVNWGRDAIARFHRLHRRSYGYADPTRAVEAITLRVQAVIPAGKKRSAGKAMKRGDGREALLGPHRIFEQGRWRRGRLYDRSRLHPGSKIAGPALIVELSATTYLPSRWTAAADRHCNLRLTRVKGGRP